MVLIMVAIASEFWQFFSDIPQQNALSIKNNNVKEIGFFFWYNRDWFLGDISFINTSNQISPHNVILFTGLTNVLTTLVNIFFYIILVFKYLNNSQPHSETRYTFVWFSGDYYQIPENFHVLA